MSCIGVYACPRQLMSGLFRCLRRCAILLGWASLTSLGLCGEGQGLALPSRSLEAATGRVSDMGLLLGDLQLQLQLVQGQGTRIVESGRPVGVYFRGKGMFSYITKDRAEVGAMAFNVEQNSSLSPTKLPSSTHVEESFSELVLIDPSMAAGWLPEGGGEDLSKAWDAFLAPFRGSLLASLEHLEALQRANAPAVPVSWALIKGAHGWFLQVLDPAQDLVERLSVLRKRSLDGAWDVVTLSEKASGWDRRQPLAPPVSLTHLALDLVASSGRGAKLVAEEWLTANQDAVKRVRFELMSHYRDWSSGGTVAYPNRVLRVCDLEGNPLPFDHRFNELLVELPQALSRGSVAKIRVEIEGEMLIRPGGDQYWKLGVMPWFPVPELFAGQNYTVDARIRVPKPYLPLASGTTVSRSEAEGWNELKVRIDKPTQFFAVQAGVYKVREDVKDGLNIRIATYGGNAADPARLARFVRQTIQFYTRILGPFPFPEFNIIQQNEWGYGQAPPGMMFLTREAFKGLEEHLVVTGCDGESYSLGSINQMFSKGVNARIAHEIAHQYWGHVVRMPNEEEQWITESFSEMSAALAVRLMKNRGNAYFNTMVNEWKAMAERVDGVCSIACANRLGSPTGSEAAMARTRLIYDKGAHLLDWIRRDVGDEVFLGFLRNFQAQFAGKFATTQDVIGYLKFYAKKDYQNLFERCFWGVEPVPQTR